MDDYRTRPRLKDKIRQSWKEGSLLPGLLVISANFVAMVSILMIAIYKPITPICVLLLFSGSIMVFAGVLAIARKKIASFDAGFNVDKGFSAIINGGFYILMGVALVYFGLVIIFR